MARVCCSFFLVLDINLICNRLSSYRENRYVLFLTENYAALDILKNPRNYLSDQISISKPKDLGKQTSKDVQPYVLFGSSFPKDKEYTQVIMKS